MSRLVVVVLAVTGLMHFVVFPTVGYCSVFEPRKAQIAPVAVPIAVVILEADCQGNRLIGCLDVVDRIGIERFTRFDGRKAPESLHWVRRYTWGNDYFRGSWSIGKRRIAETIKPCIHFVRCIWTEECPGSSYPPECGRPSIIDPMDVDPKPVAFGDMKPACIERSAVPNVGSLVSLKLFAGVVDKRAGHASLPKSDSSIDGDGDKSPKRYDKVFVAIGALVFSFGLVLLYRVWWRVYFNLPPDANVAIYVALVLISAAVIWTGMALIGHGFLLVRQVSNLPATRLVMLVPVWTRYPMFNVCTRVGIVGKAVRSDMTLRKDIEIADARRNKKLNLAILDSSLGRVLVETGTRESSKSWDFKWLHFPRQFGKLRMWVCPSPIVKYPRLVLAETRARRTRLGGLFALCPRWVGILLKIVRAPSVVKSDVVSDCGPNVSGCDFDVNYESVSGNDGGLKVLKSNTGRLLSFKIFQLSLSVLRSYRGCLGSRHHLSVLQVDEIGVHDDGSKGERGDKKHETLIVFLILSIFCMFVNLYAFWQLGENGKFWPWASVIIASLIGLAYCFSLFVQSTV
jgi:hypothetical protein